MKEQEWGQWQQIANWDKRQHESDQFYFSELHLENINGNSIMEIEYFCNTQACNVPKLEG